MLRVMWTKEAQAWLKCFRGDNISHMLKTIPLVFWPSVWLFLTLALKIYQRINWKVLHYFYSQETFQPLICTVVINNHSYADLQWKRGNRPKINTKCSFDGKRGVGELMPGPRIVLQEKRWSLTQLRIMGVVAGKTPPPSCERKPKMVSSILKALWSKACVNIIQTENQALSQGISVNWQYQQWGSSI